MRRAGADARLALRAAVRIGNTVSPGPRSRHWLLKMLGHRVDSWSLRARRALPLVVPAVAALLLLRRARA